MNVIILTADGFCFGPFRSDYDYQQNVSKLPLSSLPFTTHVLLDMHDMPTKPTKPTKPVSPLGAVSSSVPGAPGYLKDCTYCADPNGNMPPVMMHGDIDDCPSCGRSL